MADGNKENGNGVSCKTIHSKVLLKIIFWPVSQHVQINFIFTDNVYIYSVYPVMSKSPGWLNELGSWIT
jgi:hypothetical protein